MSYPLQQRLFGFSDDRNSLDSDSLSNKYSCKLNPYDNYLSYSSATATNVQLGQFNYLNTLLQQLEDCGGSTIDMWQHLRDRIRSIFDLDDDVDIIFGSSGTDIEMIATLYGISTNKKCANIVSLPEEIGSGSRHASKLSHFCNYDNHGTSVAKGARLSGFESVDLFSYTSGTKINSLNSQICNENELLSLVSELIQDDYHVQIHLIYGSKLGRVYPSLSVVNLLEQRYPGKIDVIVDACQFRLNHQCINEWLSMGRIILLSGSKFFEGVTFSGIMLLPAIMRDRINDYKSALPDSLNQYFSRVCFPTRLTKFDSIHHSPNHDSLFLRLESFMYNAERFAGIKQHRLTEVINLFCKRCDSLFKNNSQLICKKVNMQFSHSYENDILLSTIFPFILFYKGRPLSQEECRKIYSLLMTDISPHLDNNDSEFKQILSLNIHLCQPVTFEYNNSSQTAMRIALGANSLIDLSGCISSKIQDKLNSDISKIEMKMLFIIDKILKI
ncbi:hypothetical protein [Synechococcus sp. UW69]|uniref:hypothetical protein n=1 Tax=Synechococcus sp. UW69 TaxID=368493 RepID=UPI0010BDD8DA|nr:hypothetical protein [Synechococcus sp. UW69]